MANQYDRVSQQQQHDKNEAINTNAAYTDVLTLDCRKYKRGVITIKNTGGVNALQYSILATAIEGSQAPDAADDSWTALREDVQVDPGKTTFEAFSNAWTFIKVRMKHPVAATTAKVYARQTD